MNKGPEKWTERIDKERLHNIVSESPEAIAAEFEQTENDWISCFASRAFILETNLYLAKDDGEITPEEYDNYQAKIEIVKKKLNDARNNYRNQGKKLPPSDLMNELMDSLNIFE